MLSNLKKITIKTIGFDKALKLKYFFQPPKITEIIVDISASCNAKCPFCPRIFMPEERTKGFMSLELFEQILIDAKENNIHRLRLYSTAEPTLHPKFDQIIDIAKSKNFEISLSTNGSTLQKHFSSLQKIDLLQLSIEGWDKKSYEKYRYPLHFDQIHDNIRKFHEFICIQSKRPKITTNLLLTRHTNIQKYMDLWALFVDEIHIHFMYEPVAYENEKFVTKKLDTLNEYYTLQSQSNNFYCDYPFHVLTIAFDGKIALCCDDFAADLSLGNVQDGIGTIFHSEKFQIIREQFYTQNLDLCKECSRFSQPERHDVDWIRTQIESLNETQKNKIIFNY